MLVPLRRPCLPLVSVLVAAHRPTYLLEALRSALGQTHGDLEVVIVDDSGGDAVHEIVASLRLSGIS